MEKMLQQLLEGQAEIIKSQTELKQSLVRIEQEQGAKISALFDAREAQIDSNERMCDTLNRIETKLERLSLRVAYNDTQLKQVK